MKLKILRNKFLSLLLLNCLILVSNTQAFYKEKLQMLKPYIIGAVTGAAGVASVWYFKLLKNRQDPEQLLKSIDKHIKDFMYDYNDQIILIKSTENQDINLNLNPNLNSEEFSYKLTQMMLNKIVNSNLNTISFGKSIKSELDKFLDHKEYLSEKSKKLNEQDKKDSKLIEKIDTITENLESIINFLEIYYDLFLAQKSFLDLTLILEQNLNNRYEKEIKYYNSSGINFETLDNHIRSAYSSSDVFFPYLSYVDQLKYDKDKLHDILVKFVDNRFEFQDNLLNNGRFLLEVLQLTLEFVISTKTYKNEKARKPEFDREQARLKMALKERQALIDQKNMIAKSKLIKKQNKNQKLLNEKLKRENYKKELIVKEQNIRLEAARIADGITVQNEIAKNDKKWQTKVNMLNNKINQIRSNLSDLISQISLPPFNPQVVDELPGFLSNIKHKVQAVQNNL